MQHVNVHNSEKPMMAVPALSPFTLAAERMFDYVQFLHFYFRTDYVVPVRRRRYCD